MSASHKEAHSVEKPTERNLKMMAEVDKEAKETAAKKEHESYGVGKSDAIREKRRAEKQQEAYFADLDKKEDERLGQERYAKKYFRLRADYLVINFKERFFELLWKRNWIVTYEGYDAQLSKELRL